jgi:hypothetical protein
MSGHAGQKAALQVFSNRVAHGRKKKRQARAVGQDARRDEEKPRGEDERRVEQAGDGRNAARQIVAELLERMEPREPRQTGPQGARKHHKAERRPGSQPLADL